MTMAGKYARLVWSKRFFRPKSDFAMPHKEGGASLRPAHEEEE
jgi:hypothetical protein